LLTAKKVVDKTEKSDVMRFQGNVVIGMLLMMGLLVGVVGCASMEGIMNRVNPPISGGMQPAVRQITEEEFAAIQKAEQDRLREQQQQEQQSQVPVRQPYTDKF
jgi:hypothetical protein